MVILSVIAHDLVKSSYEKKPGVYIMTLDSSIQCFQTDGEWPVLAAISAVLFLVFSIGGVAALTLLSIFEKESGGMKPQFRWWGAVATGQKFLFGIGLLFSLTSEQDTMVWLTLLSLISFVAHLSFWPYKSAVKNMMELLLGLTLVVTSQAVLIFQMDISAPTQGLLEATLLFLLYGLLIATSLEAFGPAIIAILFWPCWLGFHHVRMVRRQISGR